MPSKLVKIYTGNRFTVQRIEEKLSEIGISAIVRDESKSARLAGFAANVSGELEVYVREDEYAKAMIIVRAISVR